MRFHFGALALFITVFNGLAVQRAFAAAEKRTVCTVTINSSDEKKAFRASLPATDFNFVELTDIGKTPGAVNNDWFQKACESKIQCDVLVVSGHFAGSFFGSSKMELSLDEMERNSCRNTCDGILKKPKETFLFGCNTLATKDADTRTYEEYVEALLRHPEIDRLTAERTAQARYSAMGMSFKDRMRRVFRGVPHLYGFSSIGPTGAAIKPHLDRYLKKVPNYLGHIKKIEAEQIANLVTTSNNAVNDINNSVISDSLANFAFAQCSGIMPNTIDDDLRKEVCQLYSRRLSIAQKAEVAAGMLKKDQRLAYLPSVLNFIKENEDEISRDPAARAALRTVLSDAKLWRQLDAMVNDPDEVPTIKIDLLRLNLALGRIDKATFEAKAKVALAPALRKLDRSTIDLVCSLSKEHGLNITVGAGDIDPARLRTNSGVSAFACLKTNDVQITNQILSTFSVMKNPDAIAYGLEAIMSLPGNEAGRAAAARRYVGAEDTTVDATARAAVAAIVSGPEQARMIRDLVSLPDQDQVIAYEALSNSGIKNEELARQLVGSLKYGEDESYYSRLQAIARVTPTGSSVWSEFGQAIDTEGAAFSASAAMYLKDLAKPPAAMANWALQSMQTNKAYRAYYSSLLAKTELSTNQISRLADQIVASPNSTYSASLRYIIRNQKNARFTETQRQALEGPTYHVECEIEGGDYSCKEIQR
jgi:hypothetical protein